MMWELNIYYLREILALPTLLASRADLLSIGSKLHLKFECRN